MSGWRERFPRLSAIMKDRVERREISQELRGHLEMRIQDNIDDGMSPVDARDEAYQRFGNFLSVQKTCIEIKKPRTEAIMGAFLNDLRYGTRMLTKRPGFMTVAVLTLALGIGVNSSIFSIVNAVLLRPLPYKEPNRIVQFWETNPTKGWNDDKAPCSPGNFLDWKQQSQSFEEIAAYYIGGNKGADPKSVSLSEFYLTGGDEPLRLQGLRVLGDPLSVLGVQPEIGRTFLPEESMEGKGHVVVLSHGLWKRRFGSDPSIVGKDISLSGVNTTVVGVMPVSFSFPTKEVDLWTPFGFSQNQMADFRAAHIFRVIGRLRSGVSIGQAQAEMSGIASRLEQQYPVTNKLTGVGLAVMHDWDVADTRLALYLFLGAVAFVLLIACANVANLLLARAATRSKEFALRAAMGATRDRLIRQLLTESLLLATLGGVCGAILSPICNRMVVVLNPGGIPRLDEVTLDFRVLGFTFGVTLLTAIIFGLVPAITGSKINLNEALQDAGQRGSHGGGAKMRNLLVVSEIALSLVLVIGAGLMIKSFVRLQQVNPGFDSSHLLTLKTNLPVARYRTDRQLWDFYQKVLDRIRTLPGVTAADAVSVLPTKGSTYTGDFTIEGRSPDDYGKEVLHNVVTPDYFQTMKIPLVAGRMLSTIDTGQNPVIVISEALARRHFGMEDPVGQRMKFGRPEQVRAWYTIVGVVRDVKQEGIAAEARPQVYEPFSQMANDYMNFVVRTSGDPHALISGIRGEIKAVDRDVPPFNIYTMDEVLSSSISKQRFTMFLLIVFALVALVLASVGVYGVMSYSITQRTGEIGIRMALGAQRRDVLTLVIGQGLKLVILGLAVGLVGALVLTRLMMTLLYGVSSTDPLTFASISILLAGVALLACYMPARRATRIDPLAALRYE